MKYGKTIGLVILLVLMATVGAWAQAQSGRFSVEFHQTPLSDVLGAFKRYDPNLQFALAPNLGNIPITASLVDVTVGEAIQIVLSQANLIGVLDNGVYQIREQAHRETGRVQRPTPNLGRIPMYRPYAPNEVSAGANAGAAPAASSDQSNSKDNNSPNGKGKKKYEGPLRLLTVQYADPADIASMFGGSVIQGNLSLGGSYGGGGGLGGNTGYGNNLGGGIGGLGGGLGGISSGIGTSSGIGGISSGIGGISSGIGGLSSGIGGISGY